MGRSTWAATYGNGTRRRSRVRRVVCGAAIGPHLLLLGLFPPAARQPVGEVDYIGFRVASIPEPGSIMLLGFAGMTFLYYCGKRD